MKGAPLNHINSTFQSNGQEGYNTSFLTCNRTKATVDSGPNPPTSDAPRPPTASSSLATPPPAIPLLGDGAKSCSSKRLARTSEAPPRRPLSRRSGLSLARARACERGGDGVRGR